MNLLSQDNLGVILITHHLRKQVRARLSGICQVQKQ